MQKAGPLASHHAGRGAALAKQGGQRLSAAQGGTVDPHQPSLDATAHQFQLMNTGGEGGFSGARLSQKQDRSVRSGGNQVQPFGHGLHLGVGGVHPAQQQGGMVPRGRLEPTLQSVVAGKIKVDDIQRALCRRAITRRAGLHQPRRDVAAFRQKKPADLRHMRAGGQVDMIALAILVKPVIGGKVVKLAVDLLEIPRVGHVDPDQAHLGFGRGLGDVSRSFTAGLEDRRARQEREGVRAENSRSTGKSGCAQS